MMLNQLFQTEWQPLTHPQWARLKRLLLVMLALWMSYFLLVNAFVHSLNKIAVLGVPLGTCLAVQGALIVFAITLFRFARERT
jgi:putative solute:sodium symporter small subunit